MQIIFQDPFGSLNPRMPVSDIIGEGLLAQGLTDRAARDKRVEDALELVGLRREYTRRYPHEFSGGQRQRIGVARALALGPDFIVADEPVSALDVSIQSQVLNLLLDLKRDLNLTYLFISHNLSVVQYFSRPGRGHVPRQDRRDRHGRAALPRTRATRTRSRCCRRSPRPIPRRRKSRLVLKGDVPSPAAPPSGCRFHTRCWLRERLGNPENCSTVEPQLRTFGRGGPPGGLPLGRGHQPDHGRPGRRRDARRSSRRPPRTSDTVRAAPPVRSGRRRRRRRGRRPSCSPCSSPRAAGRPSPAPAGPRRPSPRSRPRRPPRRRRPRPAPEPERDALAGRRRRGRVNLGASRTQVQAAGADLGAAAGDQDLKAMWGAADGLATLIERAADAGRRGSRTIPSRRRPPRRTRRPCPDMLAGRRRKLRDSITAGDAAGVTAGSEQLAKGLEAYAAGPRALIGPLVDEALLMQRQLVK